MNKWFNIAVSLSILILGTLVLASWDEGEKALPLSTTALEWTADGKAVVLVQKTAFRVDLMDYATGTIQYSVAFEEEPNGVVVVGDIAYITSSHAQGYVTAIEISSGNTLFKSPVGMGACSPVWDAKRQRLYVSNQFKNTVVAFDPAAQKVLAEVALLREPKASVMSADGAFLYVNNFLPAQRADVDIVASKVSVIDLNSFERIKDIQLDNGSNALRDICLSPEGDYVLISHNLGRFQVPTSQLQQGWMNTSGFSVITTADQKYQGTVLVDEPEYGAAGVWGIACNKDHLLVTHSGTHDFSLIDYPAFKEKFEQVSDKSTLCYDLRFLTGIRSRVKVAGNGPRDLIMRQDEVIIPTYFSDSLNVFKVDHTTATPERILALNPNMHESQERLGEKYFNDAVHCFQGWQSCNGCHPGDARTDAMNWDLLNDGIGNPKNCKSMLYSHKTAPSMISGIRPDAETAVKAGFTHIQFAQVTPDITNAVDAYLKALRPLPSPYLIEGELSEKAQAGKKIFLKKKCDYCHSGPLYTDQKMHRIGDVEFEKGWDTPTLIEVWRTAPYLHDGRAATLEDLFSVDKHGLKGKKLKHKELDALVEYVNSL